MFNTDEKRRIIQGMQEAQNNPCVLCGRKAAMGNIFLPATAERQGKIIIYGLCKKCSKKAGAQERAEAIILGDAK